MQLMGFAKTVADLNRQIYDFVYGKLFLLDDISKRFSLYILHNDAGPALVLAHLMDGDDIGMLQYRGGVGLALKPGATVFVPAKMRGEEFKSNLAVECSVFGQIHFAHTSCAYFLDDPVVRDHRRAVNERVLLF
jgi:hypothetical protein